MSSKKTLVIGASENPFRYAHTAINRLSNKGHEVIAIGKLKGRVNSTEIVTEMIAHRDVDTITLYINPDIQKKYYEYIIDLKPKRIIFNPGTENPELRQLALDNGIEPIEACTLVMLSTGLY